MNNNMFQLLEKAAKKTVEKCAGILAVKVVSNSESVISTEEKQVYEMHQVIGKYYRAVNKINQAVRELDTIIHS